ncbi:hypothetical protein OROGR_029339 [Orobanche gracilis]
MEHKKKEKAKKRDASTSARKSTPLMERERNEKKVKEYKGKEKKGKAENGKAENGKSAKENAATPASKSASTMRFWHKNMACNICLTRDHWSSSCPNGEILRPGSAATVIGRYAKIICLCCGEEMPHPGEPGVDWPARAILKGDACAPSVEQQLRELNINKSKSKGAAYQFEKGTKKVN